MKPPMKLRIQKQVMSEIFRHAMADFPDECCGFLYGTEEGGRLIHDVRRAPNARQGDKRRRFTIDPADYLKAETFARDNGVSLLGIYHSHPLHPAIASEHDLKQAMPYFSYVIVSVFEDRVEELRSFRLHDSGQHFEEEWVQS